MPYAFSYVLCIDVGWYQYRLFLWSGFLLWNATFPRQGQGRGHPGVPRAGREKKKNHISIIAHIQQMKHARLTHWRAEQTINYTSCAVTYGIISQAAREYGLWDAAKKMPLFT